MENNIDYPVCCVLGHVDVGKTKFLDKLRSTKIQLREVGGITQEIGSTFFDKEFLEQMTNSISSIKLDIDGLIMIDTPGHDCFTQMRMTGVKISHLAIIIVDVLKGLEKQTIQCIKLLKQYDTNFIIGLNKIDKIYGWRTQNNSSLKKTFEKQTVQVMNQLKDYINKITVQLAELEINSLPYYENKNYKEYVSMVPLSAQSGEGIADMIMMISKMTSKNMIKSKILKNLAKYDYGFILDIKKDEKFGILYHSIFMKGVMKKTDEILIEGIDSVINTSIKDIFIPDNQNEMKSKMHLSSIETLNRTKAVALKLANGDLENTINIGGLFVIKNSQENVDEIIDLMNKSSLNSKKYKFEKKGIIINVPSKSMADAVIEIIKEKKEIKIKQINVGIINKSIITKVSNTSNFEKNTLEYIYNKKYMVILDYNCNFKDIESEKKMYDRELINFANENDVQIMSANTIYKLFDNYNIYMNDIKNKIKIMYPNISKGFELEIIPKYIFLKKTPLLFGVKIIRGTVKKNNFVVAVNDDKKIIIGKITSIQKNNKNIEEAEKEDICIKIEGGDNIEYGRHFDEKWKLIHYMTDEEKIIYQKYKDVFSR